MIKILVVDDSALVRKLFGRVLGKEPDFEVEFARPFLCFGEHGDDQRVARFEPLGFFEASDLFAARPDALERGRRSQLLAELSGQQIEPLCEAFRAVVRPL